MSKNMNKDMDGKALGKAKAAGRVVTVAAATIAMTGGSMLSPLVAVAQDADGVGATGATAAVMSPLTSTAAAGTGAGAVSAAQRSPTCRLQLMRRALKLLPPRPIWKRLPLLRCCRRQPAAGAGRL